MPPSHELPQHQLERAAEEAQVLRLTTRDQLEALLDGLIRAARLPRPETNVRVAGHEVDFLRRDHKLVVEVDGFAFHATRAAFERDRARDADLQAAGYRVIRLTWRQIVVEPHAVVARPARLMPPWPA